MWLGARIFASIVLGISASSNATAVPDSSAPGLEVIPWVFSFAAAFIFLDLQRRRELMLWRNLGLWPGTVVAVALVPGAVVELVLRFL